MIAITLTMLALFVQSPAKPASDQPDFFDKPQFVVSGVADYTYRGGHGSDTVLRSTEALTKATASLSAATETMSISDAAEKEKALMEQIARDPKNAKAYHELASVEERLGKPLDAVHEYQRAAEMDASETNLFDWGAELLKHRAGEPAVAIFTNGARSFPNSVRMQLGLAVAFHLEGEYDKAAEHFFKATDMTPNDATPYLFLGKVEAKEITGSPDYLERLARFAANEPQNALANYYYAESLWQRRTNPDRVSLLAQRAINLDPKLGPAYLLLGKLCAEQKNLPDAISMLRKATEVTPDLAEAHYRLAQAYELNGNAADAERERTTYKELAAKSAADTERERQEIQRFVFKPSEK